VIHPLRFAAILGASILCGVGATPAPARDLTDPPAELDVAAPDSQPNAAASAARSAVKKAKKARAATPKPVAAAQPHAPASENADVAPRKSGAADDPVSVGLKWNGTKEPDYGAGTSLRQINQQIDSHILGGSAPPVGAGAEVGVKYKF
jgi:hypothetical protein